MTKNLVIRASAGSGKTFRLTLRFLDLLLAGESAERIFATTFTRKAAGEILERVLQRLSSALLDDEERNTLGEQLGRPNLSRSDLSRTLTSLIASIHRLRVDTLDSFFVRLATAYALDLSLPPKWTIADPVRELQLRARAVEGLLRDDGVEQLRTLVTLLAKGEVRRSVGQQILDVVGNLYPLFLDAPIAELWRTIPAAWVAEARLSERELADAKAALEALSPPLKRNGTPDGVWEKALRQHVDAVAHDDWLGFARGGIASKLLSGVQRFGRHTIPDNALAVFDPLLRHAASILATTVAQQTAATYELLTRYHRSYASLAQSSATFTFDGITRILAGAKTLGHLDDVYYRLDADLHHVLLDEFQDTSLPQWLVLEPLAQEAASQPLDHTFFCVGDEKQSIYGWRGGSPEIFGWLERDLPGIESEPMDKSYRSSPAVIDTVNEIFEARGPITRTFGGEESGLTEWLDGFRAHQTALDIQGYTCLRTAPRATDGQPVATLIHAADYVEELLVRDPESSVGVLLRRNQAVSRMIHELRSRGIPASDEGGNPLTDSPAVAVILSLMKLADHPADSVAAFHVATSPLFSAIEADRGPDEIAAHEYPHQDPTVVRCARGVRRAISDQGVAEALRPWIRALSAVSGSRDSRRLAQLLALAERFAPPGAIRARDFLDHVAMVKVDDPEEAAVRVMTVHQAKGLEFDRVVLPELDQRIPGQTPIALVVRDRDDGSVIEVSRFANQAVRSLIDYATELPGGEIAATGFDQLHDAYRNKEIRESLSLLYVALTRARRELHMIIAPSSPNEAKIPATFAGILRAALTDGGPSSKPETILYEHGAHPGPTVPVDPVLVTTRDETAIKPIPLSKRRRVRVYARPSDHSVTTGTADRHLAARPRVALERGETLHGVLERIEWLDDQALSQLRGVGLDSHDTLCQALSRDGFENRLSQALEQSTSGMEIEVFREHPFVDGDADTLVSGVIDRLVIASRDGRPLFAEITDFKSDTVSDDVEWKDLTDRYTPQLESYRRAIQRLFRVPLISTCLLSLSTNRVHRVARSTSQGGEPHGGAAGRNADPVKRGETAPPPPRDAPRVPSVAAPNPADRTAADRTGSTRNTASPQGDVDPVEVNNESERDQPLSTQLDLFAESEDVDRD